VEKYLGKILCRILSWALGEKWALGSIALICCNECGSKTDNDLKTMLPNFQQFVNKQKLIFC